MQSTNNAAQDPLGLLIVILVGAVFLAIGGMRLRSRLRRWRWRNFSRRPWQQWGRSTGVGRWQAPGSFAPAMPADAADQLRIVMEADFAMQPLLNQSEARLFRELDRVVSACNPTWRVMAQVSLGEILMSKDVAAYRCINAKRVDLLLMDGACQPRHAIEYQGGAHHQGMAAARDAVKKEALRRAGIGYHEVVAGFTTPAELRRLVEKLVDKPDVPVRP
jgi:hypothetical protein